MKNAILIKSNEAYRISVIAYKADSTSTAKSVSMAIGSYVPTSKDERVATGDEAIEAIESFHPSVKAESSSGKAQATYTEISIARKDQYGMFIPVMKKALDQDENEVTLIANSEFQILDMMAWRHHEDGFEFPKVNAEEITEDGINYDVPTLFETTDFQEAKRYLDGCEARIDIGVEDGMFTRKTDQFHEFALVQATEWKESEDDFDGDWFDWDTIEEKRLER